MVKYEVVKAGVPEGGARWVGETSEVQVQV